MKKDVKKVDGIDALDPESRRRFCLQVLESLSDLVEGEAPEDFCREVDRLLGDCQPFVAFRNTFEATIRATRGLGSEERLRAQADDQSLARCLERARAVLGRRPPETT